MSTQVYEYKNNYVKILSKCTFYLGSQSLLSCLQEATTNVTLSIGERESAKDLLTSILNDDFLLISISN